jgi:hypothetical protein
MDAIPDAELLPFFKSAYAREGGLTEKLLDTFEKHLQDQGLETAESQVIDATIIPMLI